MTTSQAEKFSSSRSRMCVGLSVVSAVWTGIVILQMRAEGARWITVAAWGAWMLVTVAWVFGWPGWWRWSPRERGIINDELTRDHQRSAALTAAFLLMVGLGAGSAASFAGSGLPSWWPVLTLGMGVTATGLHFAWLQHRAQR